MKHVETRITKNYEFKKGVGIDSTTEARILLAQFSLQKFNPYFWHKSKSRSKYLYNEPKVGIKLL